VGEPSRAPTARSTAISDPNGSPIAHTHTIDIESLDPEQRSQLPGVLLALKARRIEAIKSPDAG